ncbi:MAG: hypothetical protein FJZ58_05790 [Chlamydiae bacterium]|nr:hypothetical protein [Chlamydiota bacterium]
MSYRACIFMLSALSVVSPLVGQAQIQLVDNNTQAPSKPNPNIKEELVQGLVTIGVPMSDILAMKETGKPSRAVVDAMTAFANNSNSAVYDGLSPAQKGALTLFCFVLHADKKLSKEALDTLMRDEKVAMGMSLSEVDQVQTLTSQILANPNYQLTQEDQEFIQSIIPYMGQNPYAFADTVGPLIGNLLYNDNEGYTTPNPQLEQELIEVAQVLTGLSSDQVTNITNITDTYNTNQSFTPTPENVTDINEVMAVSTLPYGLYALYPFLGVTGVAAIDDMVATEPDYWNQAEADHWDNANARENYYHNTVQPNQEQRQSDVSQHQSDVDTRQSEAGNTSAQRESTVSGRESNVSSAEADRSQSWGSWGRGSSLNWDNVRGSEGRGEYGRGRTGGGGHSR